MPDKPTVDEQTHNGRTHEARADGRTYGRTNAKKVTAISIAPQRVRQKAAVKRHFKDNILYIVHTTAILCVFVTCYMSFYKLNMFYFLSKQYLLQRRCLN